MSVSVPLHMGSIERNDKRKLVEMLRDLNAEEVIMFIPTYTPDDNELFFNLVKKYDKFFQENGFKTAVWVITTTAFSKKKYTQLTTFEGNLLPYKCLLDVEFGEDYCKYIEQVAATGIKKIVLEDEFRMQITSLKAACFCDEHIKLYGKYLNRKTTREEMGEKVFAASKNEYREAWIRSNRETLTNFAKRIRAAIDKVDGSIEVRLCCGPSLFGADGSDAFELAEVLKNDKGYVELRLIGAPYWGWNFNMNTASAIDFARSQALECRKRGIKVVGEGDPCPRPRHFVSAAELEFFHTVTLADGNFDGIQKYALDYYSSCEYETGYVEMHKENSWIYQEIEKAFGDKRCVGVHLIEPFDWIYKAEKIPTAPEKRVMNTASRKFVNDISVPTCFEEGGVNVIFGETARMIQKSWLKNGSVLDINAALILQDLGIDVGIEKAKETVVSANGAKITNGDAAVEEYFGEKSTDVCVRIRPNSCYDLTLKTGATVKSRLHYDNVFIGSYTYENADGERFLVYNFDAEFGMRNAEMARNYARQKQFVDLYEYLNGKKLEATCVGNPFLYMLVKKNETGLAVGLWNHFEDPTLNKEICLGKRYKNARFINCEGVLKEDKIILTKPIPPFGMAFIELFE